MSAARPALVAMLAHQGGWDEILLVLGPIGVVIALLWLAKRRVDRHELDDPPGSTARTADHPARTTTPPP